MMKMQRDSTKLKENRFNFFGNVFRKTETSVLSDFSQYLIVASSGGTLIEYQINGSLIFFLILAS